MRSYVQVLTTPTADTPGTTLLLHFDNKRYLIGSLAEGTQRASVQIGARLLKVGECFITGRTEWSNIGGLLGMILTLADSSSSSQASSLEDALKKARSKSKQLGVAEDAEKVRELEDKARKESGNNTLTLFGAPNLTHTLATSRRFVFRKGMPIDVHEVQEERGRLEGDEDWAPYWADQNIKVWTMAILPSDVSKPVTRPQTSSPRKRSSDEAFASESLTDDVPASANGASSASNTFTSEERNLLTVRAVVGEMFNSSWRLDTLYETRLADVQMPASIFVRNQETNKVEKYRGPPPGSSQSLADPDLPVLVRRPWPGALVESLPATQPAQEAISYIIRNHTQRGKFNTEKAVALKVEKGLKWAQLAAGNDVMNVDGDTVTPDQVLGESREGGGIAVVDLPDCRYIDGLLRRPEWQEDKVIGGVGAIFWICGPNVATDSRLASFMKEYSRMKHVISSPEYCTNNIAFDSAAAATVRLKQIDPKRYAIPAHDNEPSIDDNLSSPSEDGIFRAKRGQVIQLEPAMEVNEKQVIPSLNVDTVISSMSTEVLEEASKVQASVLADRPNLEQWATSLPDKEADITTLGTGSALPSKYRNVSATLLRVPGWGNVLFDCGENTLGQLKRVFSTEEFKEVLQNLKIIVISHMHADHHLGTASVIKAWYEEVHKSKPAPPPSRSATTERMFEDTQRLAVIAEPAMALWLSEYAAVEDYGFSHLAPLTISPAVPHRKIRSELKWFTPPTEVAGMNYSQRTANKIMTTVSPSLLGLEDVQAVAVTHCHGARAMSITWRSGLKVSYSGDCRPSAAFSQIGKGSTVCIHEATFDDELQGDAEAKNHSTTSEALGVAQAMGSRACVLTHFSQRYQKLPVLEHGKPDDEDVAHTITQDVPMMDGLPEEEDAAAAHPDDVFEAPLEDAAATLPDQSTANTNGQQYDIPSKRTDIAQSKTKPDSAAVKFKLNTDMKVCVAFDYMRVKIGEIAEMQHYTPALLKLFAEEEKPDDLEANNEGKQSKGVKTKKEKKINKPKRFN